jgi:hypothetical protein
MKIYKGGFAETGVKDEISQVNAFAKTQLAAEDALPRAEQSSSHLKQRQYMPENCGALPVLMHAMQERQGTFHLRVFFAWQRLP